MIFEKLSYREKKEFKLATALGVGWNKKFFILKSLLALLFLFIIPNILGYVYDLNFQPLIAFTACLASLLAINNLRVKSQRKIIPLGYDQLCPAQQKLGNLLKSIHDNKNNDTKITDEKFELLAFEDWYCWVTLLSPSKDRTILLLRIAFSDCTFPIAVPNKFKENLLFVKKDDLYRINVKFNPKNEVESFEVSLS